MINEAGQTAADARGQLLSWPPGEPNSLSWRKKKREETNERRVKRKEKFAEAEERNAAGGAGGGNRQQVSQCLSALKAQMRSFKSLLFQSVYHMHTPRAPKSTSDPENLVYSWTGSRVGLCSLTKPSNPGLGHLLLNDWNISLRSKFYLKWIVYMTSPHWRSHLLLGLIIYSLN